MNRLVLVHGLGVSPRYFEPLQRVVRAEAPDLRGAASLAGQAALLERALGDEPAVLVANSYGCQIVTELALRRLELVTRAVFVGPSGDRRRRSWIRQGAQLALNATREPPSLVLLALRDYLATGPLRTLRMARAALADRPETKLPRLEVPLLVVRGERDAICPQDWAEEVAALAPDARLEVVPGAAHAVHYSHPRELAALVEEAP